ncbi:MFS transporter [Actinorugispora endophytica]|uniref:Putative MFS family arabinose efflux permease n=1 Tax=Actinorugispora endophytica TaxID=1605990 RepID=A0A4R6V7Q5_9ACTN|nr:MFS transporter [Actinorugispora endophytica]TDQ52366.1 putative MFS family arabinose efflux permease [Actinorugispora endophytica]
MSPLSTLRRMREIAGTPLLLSSFLARLPMSMSLIGILTLVTAETGSVAAGGLASGALALGETVGGPVIARLADRRGQRPVVLAASLAEGALLVLLVLAVSADTAPAVPVALAVLAGLAMPQIGPLARSRWISIAGRAANERERERSVAAAMSVDGVLDETGFVVGPAVVGLLAVAVGPAAAVLGAAVLVAVFGSAFALHRTAPLGAPPRPGGERLWRSGLLVLAVPMFCQGAFFGGATAGVTAFSQQIGRPDLSGLLYAVMGVTSAAAGLLMASVPSGVTLPVRLRLAAAGLAVFSLPMLAAPGTGTLLAAMLLLGTAVGPHLVTVFSLVERAAPADRLAQAMTVLLSFLILGQSLGSAAAGRLAERFGPSGAFALTTAAAATALVAATLLVRSRWYTTRPGETAPTPV